MGAFDGYTNRSNMVEIKMDKCEEGELLCSSPEDQHATNGYGKKIAVAAVVALFVVAAGVAVYSGFNGAKGVQDSAHELAARRASCSSDDMIIQSYDYGLILMDDNNAGNSRSADWVSYTTKAGSRWKIKLAGTSTNSGKCKPCTNNDKGCTHPGNADQAWCDSRCTNGKNDATVCPVSHCTCGTSSGSGSASGGRRVSTRRAATKATFSIQRVGTDQ